MHLSVDFDDRDVPRINVAGECDVSSVEALRAAASDVIATLSPGARVTIDLHALTFLDCCALGALVAISNEAASRDIELRLRAVSVPVSRLLTLTAMQDFFTIDS